MEQKAGDKSGELSVKTQDMLEEASQDMVDDDDEDDDDDVIDDDDLSEQLSYGNEDESDEEHNGESSSIDGEEEEENENHVMSTEGLGADEHVIAEISHGEEEEDTRMMIDDDESVETEEGDLLSALPRGQFEGVLSHDDAHGTLQDLIEVYSTRNQISFNQYERSLRQLHAKWESIHENDMLMLDQERHNMELHIEELRRHHENDIEASKAEVLEQSQKIILEEMKANAHRERKSEADIEIAVKEAVDKVRAEMEEDFEISISGMQAAQEDLKKRYDKLIKDAESRVREEVEVEAKAQYEAKMEAFNEEYEDMKHKIVELTMENEKLEILGGQNGSSKETDALIASLENEVNVLKKNLAHAKEEIKKFSRPQDQTDDAVTLAVNSAVQETEQRIRKDYENKLESMKASQKEMSIKYEHMVKDTEMRVRGEVLEEASLKAEKDLSSFKEEYENMKKQVLELSNEMKSLEDEVSGKCSHIEELTISNQYKAKEVEILNSNMKHKNELIEKLQLDLKAKSEEITRVTKEIDVITHSGKLASQDQLKYEKEIRDYEKEIRELQSKIASEVRKHDESAVKAEKHFNETIEELRRNHMSEMNRVHQNHTRENHELKDMVIALQDEKKVLDKNNKELKDIIATMKRDHQSAITKLEEEHNRESLETLKLIDQLRTEKDKEISRNNEPATSIKSAPSVKSAASSKKSVKRKTPIIEGVPLEDQLKSISGSSKSRKTEEGKEHGIDNYSHSSIGKTTITTRKSIGNYETPSKGQITEKVVVDVSPLGMGSPSGVAMRTPMQKVERTPSKRVTTMRKKVPQTVDTNRRVRKVQEEENIPMTVESSRRFRRAMSEVKRDTPVARKRETTSKSVGSPSNSIYSKTSTKTPLKKGNTSPKRIFASARKSTTLAPAPLAPLVGSEVRLLILNVPVSDRILMMCSILGIEIVDDPLLATHVIAGDGEHKIRRTAKLMASLCVTPNIMRLDWLEDSYKSIQIMSPNPYLLLNDRVAEKAYGFSMKMTLREGNERRNEGGLLYGWKILVCDGVAGNKAPKESELQMMIKAAGGQWITTSDIPIPVEEDPTHVIVLTSDPATPDQRDNENAQVAAENGAGFFTTSWLFDSMMHQKLFGIKRGLGRV